MTDRPFTGLRYLAAGLISLSGGALVAALWLRELNGAAVIDALIGAVYLITGIGLFGQSRFTLFMAIAIPATAAWYVVQYFPGAGPLYDARLAVDAAVVLCSAAALWRVRNAASI